MLRFLSESIWHDTWEYVEQNISQLMWFGLQHTTRVIDGNDGNDAIKSWKTSSDIVCQRDESWFVFGITWSFYIHGHLKHGSDPFISERKKTDRKKNNKNNNTHTLLLKSIFYSPCIHCKTEEQTICVLWNVPSKIAMQIVHFSF